MPYDAIDYINASIASDAPGLANAIVEQATPPGSPAVGQRWRDTSFTPPVLRVWDGANWAVPLDQENLDRMEQGISDATAAAEAAGGTVTGMATVDTVVSMKSLSAADGERVQALGYHSVGDGGGGIFERDTGLATFDEGITVDHSSAAGGWQRILLMGTRHVNVKWWGAKGDGTGSGGQANQEVYFKRAADYLIANNNRGGVVYVPAGVYNIHAKIDLTSSVDYRSVAFVGLGSLRTWNQGYPGSLAGSVLVAKTSGITILEYCSPAGTSTNFGGPYIENITFKDGTGASGAAGHTATGLRMNICNDWRVERCSFLELKYGLVNYSHNLNKGRDGSDQVNFPIESGYERVTSGHDGDASWGHVHNCGFNDNTFGLFTPHSGGMLVDGECRFSIPIDGVGIAKYGGSQLKVCNNKIDGETVADANTTFIESDGEKDQIFGNQYEDVTTFYRCRDNGGIASGNAQLVYGNTGYGAFSDTFIDAGAGTTGNRFGNSLTGVGTELGGPDSSGWTKAL